MKVADLKAEIDAAWAERQARDERERMWSEIACQLMEWLVEDVQAMPAASLTNAVVAEQSAQLQVNEQRALLGQPMLQGTLKEILVHGARRQ